MEFIQRGAGNRRGCGLSPSHPCHRGTKTGQAKGQTNATYLPRYWVGVVCDAGGLVGVRRHGERPGPLFWAVRGRESSWGRNFGADAPVPVRKTAKIGGRHHPRDPDARAGARRLTGLVEAVRVVPAGAQCFCVWLLK